MHVQMDAAPAPAVDLSTAPLDIITLVLETMCDKDRFTCALVCTAWAKVAAAATRVIRVLQPIAAVQLNCLQQWLEKHGNHVQVLQLNSCSEADLTALPCAQLQDLVLIDDNEDVTYLYVSSRVWGDIAAATKLTSVSLSGLYTAAQQADVVSALTALPDLKQLTWIDVLCDEQKLSDSLLLQHLTRLTALKLQDVSAAALEHLGSLTKLENLSIKVAKGWAAAGCPGLQELKALTKLQLWQDEAGIPASVVQLTALQELYVSKPTPTAFVSLQALTGLTRLHVGQFRGMPLESPPLQLPGLQHLVVRGWFAPLPMLFLASCTQLRVLELWACRLGGPGSLVTSTMLQDLVLYECRLSAADGVAGGPASWQQVFPGPGRLPHLTSLQLTCTQPDLQQADIERVVACCSSLQVLHTTTLQDSFASALAQLSGLTKLRLMDAGDEQCGAVAQLTGLRELTVQSPREVSAAGLRQLAALEQLTSLGFIDSWPSKVSHVVQMSDRLSGCSHAFVNQVPAGHPSDVPARLLRMCDLAATYDS